MGDQERIEEIKNRLRANEYFVHPLSDSNVEKDIQYLIALVAKKEAKIADLERNAKTLSKQVMELTQEIENTKSDFGGMR